MPFENNCFPDNLKYTKVIPVFKKNHGPDKENHRTDSVLFHVWKVLERIVYNLLDNFTKDKLSNL